MGINELGLLFIGAAWFVQVFSTGKNQEKLSKQFVLLYALGTAMLVLQAIASQSKVTSLLSLISLAGSLVVYFKMK